MTSTAVVNRETGEVTEVRQHFDPNGYLASLAPSLKTQHALAAAYDAACAALIGPNDVQAEGGRTFKKKSAWRKLARHFGISTAVVGEPRLLWQGQDYHAVVTVRATAPWGQSAEAIGACGTDEESGRREISVADALATAQTRATNRAVSDLIAMGEVSAEEITRSSGKAKKPLRERDDQELAGLRDWAEQQGKLDLVANIDREVERRALQS